MPVFISCKESYWPDLEGRYQNLLVVDGMISNEPGPYIIKLSQSSPVGDPGYIPVGGYTIIIRDDQGNEEELFETEGGTYSTLADGIQGVIGRHYKLEITAPSGKIFGSDYELLREPTGIESVYPVIEYHESNELNHDIAGYQFYINTTLAEQANNYYLWNLTSTYEYKADLKIRYIYDGTFRPFMAWDSLRTCWKTDNIMEIFTYSTTSLNEPVLRNYPLNYVNTETRELSIRYSLLVKQLTISENAYKFWTLAKEQNSEIGGLHPQQPFQIRGNIKSLDNSDDFILGYFMVAGVAEKRIFVDRPPYQVKMYYPICVVGDGDVENFGSIFYTTESSWPVYATTDNKGRLAYPNQECLNCELSGGVINRPEFWIDK